MPTYFRGSGVGMPCCLYAHAMVATVISSVSVAVSLLLVAWQSREVARQTKVDTQAVIGSSAGTAMTLLQTVQLRLLDYPQFVPYLYEGQRAEPEPYELRVLAEVLADAANYGCEVGAEMPLAAHRMSGFPNFGAFLLNNSPIVRDLVVEHPEWYPELYRLL